jgi:1,6-anhydro-N-acetylmuramate kinase
MTTFRKAVADLLENHDISVDEAGDRHISPDFRQRTNGHWIGRREFLDRIAEIRSNTVEITITVLDEIIVGEHYSERHIGDLLGFDGRREVHEVYVFATLDLDGRFKIVEEVTLALSPDAVMSAHWPQRVTTAA